jgi:HlyD family secretion protein
MKRKYWIYAGIGLIIIILLILASQKNKKTATFVEVDKAKERTIVETVTASGHIKPETEIKITPYISGEVIELYVKEGDQVKEGELLAKIDPKIYVSNLERAKAALQQQKAQLSNSKARLAQSKAKLSKAQLDFDRNKKLYEQKVISQSDYENIQSSFNISKQEVIAAKESVKAAEFSVQSTIANLKEAEENLSRTAVYAPASGTVSSLRVAKGERVSGASQFSAGTELMKIANLNRMIVEVDVNENDIIKVKMNDTSIIEVDAYVDRTFTGLVKEISTSSKSSGLGTDEVTNYGVKILILESSYQDIENQATYPFRPGMSASVDIQTKIRRNVVSVPIQAVVLRADSTNEEQEAVFVYSGGQVNIRWVQTGIQDREFMEITKGINTNDDIVTGPYRTLSKKLKDKEKVKIKSKNAN